MDELANLSPEKIDKILGRLEAEKIRRLSELAGRPDAYIAPVKKIEWLAWMRDMDFPAVLKSDVLYDPPSKPDRVVSKLPPSAKVVSLSEARARRGNTDLGEAYR